MGIWNITLGSRSALIPQLASMFALGEVEVEKDVISAPGIRQTC